MATPEDGVTSSQVCISHEHHEMHEGEHYFYKAELDDAGGAGLFLPN